MKPYHNTPVLEFHQVFGHPVNNTPTVPPIDERVLRINMLAEELVETAIAMGVVLHVDSLEDHKADRITTMSLHEFDGRPDHCDLVEVADGLGDLRYLTDGANLVFGLPGDAVLAEIHRSNMSKLGLDGLPVRRADGKTLKGPCYTPPDIAWVLRFGS